MVTAAVVVVVMLWIVHQISKFQPCSLNFLKYGQIWLMLHFKAFSICECIMGMVLWMVLDCKACWMKEWCRDGRQTRPFITPSFSRVYDPTQRSKLVILVLRIYNLMPFIMPYVPVVVYLLFAQLNFVSLIFYLLGFVDALVEWFSNFCAFRRRHYLSFCIVRIYASADQDWFLAVIVMWQSCLLLVTLRLSMMLISIRAAYCMCF